MEVTGNIYKIVKSVSLNVLLFAVLLPALCCSQLWAQEGVNVKLKCVVLDPGHGGKDYGCISRDKKYNEKNIVLSVALKLGAMIEKNHPDVKVIYTRKTDVFIPLADRAKIANKNKADLFLSIHVNSTGKSDAAHGTETFTMGNHVSQSNFEISKRENSVILMEDDYTTKYEGFDPDSPESYIIFSLLQNAYSEQSIKFAQQIQNQFHLGPIKYSRGVKQAGFLVLKNTTMPSVLTELGFISNQEDLKILTSESGQNQIVKRLYDAFVEYKKEYEKGSSDQRIAEEEQIVQNTEPQEETDVKKDAVEKETAEKETAENVPAVDIKEPAKDTVKELPQDQVKEPVKEQVKEPAKEVVKKASDVTYHIQILSVGKLLRANAPDLKGAKDVKYIKQNGLYKYYLGEYNSREEARSDLDKVRKKFAGAFIIGVKNGEIVSR